MLRGLLYASGNSGLLRVRGVRRALAALIVRLKRFALSRDLNAQSRADPYLMSYPTGFGIAATAGGLRSDLCSSDVHSSEHQSLMRKSFPVFCRNQNLPAH